MLYLSRLILDDRSEAVRRDLADCHKLHRRILSAFPEAPSSDNARSHFGVLYRAERMETEARLLRLLVQSSSVPDWTSLPAGYLGPSPDQRGNPAMRPVSEEYARIRAGMQLMFRLRANPTKRISGKNAQEQPVWHGKRVELRREEELLDWLTRKGMQGGFQLLGFTVRRDIPDTRVATLEKTRGWQRSQGQREAARLTFGAVLFEGRLEVTDKTRFLSTLRNGLGSGKSFGFGLLSIATAR